MELVRTVGILLKRGWKPRRTIIFASWDASDYGAVGSTEWVEDHHYWLTEEAVAYLHVEAVVSGTQLNVQASPLLHQLFKDITAASQINYTMALPNVDTDASPFFSHLGISSLSMDLQTNNMSGAVDANFELEQKMTRIWGQLIVHLSSESLLPLHPNDTTTAIARFLDEYDNLPYSAAAIQSLHSTSAYIEEHTANLRHQLKVKKHISRKLVKQIARANARFMTFERSFLRPIKDGWYRHMVYGPDLHTGVSRMLPALVDAVQSGNMSFVEEVDLKMAKLLMDAERTLWDSQLGDD